MATFSNRTEAALAVMAIWTASIAAALALLNRLAGGAMPIQDLFGSLGGLFWSPILISIPVMKSLEDVGSSLTGSLSFNFAVFAFISLLPALVYWGTLAWLTYTTISRMSKGRAACLAGISVAGSIALPFFFVVLADF